MSNKIKTLIKGVYINQKILIDLFLRKKRNQIIIKQNIKKNIFPVEIISGMGLFANLTFALYITKFCQEQKLTPHFKFTLENSTIKGNPFDYFFKIKSNNKKQPGKINYAKMKSWSDLNMNIDWTKYQSLNIQSAEDLINKHFTINKSVLDKVESFYNEKLKNKNVLGLHYRATDKCSEANLLSYNYIIKQLNIYIEKYPQTELLFVSTDDINFIPYLENNFLKIPITYNQDSFRSNNQISTHKSGKNLYDINLDAITNCLLLSKCTRLMKTASILSAWSKLFNPDLPVIILSKPKETFNFFPEKQVAESTLYEVSNS